MKRRRYQLLVDGEWVRPAMRGFREQCCHCGLVHVVDYRILDNRIEFRARVDSRATAAARRAFDFTKGDEE